MENQEVPEEYREQTSYVASPKTNTSGFQRAKYFSAIRTGMS